MADLQKYAPEISAQDAIRQYEQVAQEQATDAAAQFNLASALYVAHQYDEAIQVFEQVVRLQDDNYHAHYYLGALYARRGDMERARREWERVQKEANNYILKAQAQTQLRELFIKN